MPPRQMPPHHSAQPRTDCFAPKNLNMLTPHGHPCSHLAHPCTLLNLAQAPAVPLVAHCVMRSWHFPALPMNPPSFCCWSLLVSAALPNLPFPQCQATITCIFTCFLSTPDHCRTVFLWAPFHLPCLVLPTRPDHPPPLPFLKLSGRVGHHACHHACRRTAHLHSAVLPACLHPLASLSRFVCLACV